jgi:predicted GNAT superfamily acetyltransferase
MQPTLANGRRRSYCCSDYQILDKQAVGTVSLIDGGHFIRDATEADFETLLRLNLESENVLSPLSLSQLETLYAHAWYFRVIGARDRVHGFLLALGEGASYQSVNYRWFAVRYSEFLYIDRVVIDSAARGQHLGAQLYEDLFTVARAAGLKRITCEFDTDPPNEASRRFHARFGFREVGSQQVASGKKTVSLQEVAL